MYEVRLLASYDGQATEALLTHMHEEDSVKYKCHGILHDGDGPLLNPANIEATSPEAAAEAMALRLWEVEGEDDLQEEGDYQWVAVEIPENDGHYRVFKVVVKVVREFLPRPVGSFTRQQIDGMKMHELTKFHHV